MKKNKNKYGAVSTVAGDTYLTGSVSLTYLFLVRLVLVCVIGGCAPVIIAQFYSVPVDLWQIGLLGAGFSALFFILYSLFNKWLVSGGILIAAGAILYIYRTRLIKGFFYFSDWILKSLDSRLLHTESFLHYRSDLIIPSSVTVQEACTLYMVILAALLALIFTVSLRTRLRTATVVFTEILLVLPCFAAETADFYWTIVPFAAAVVGFETVWSSYELEANYIFWGLRKSAYALNKEESKYSKKTARYYPARKIKSDLPRYNKYTGNALAAVIIFGGLMTVFASIATQTPVIDYEKLYQDISDMYVRAVNGIESTFNFNLNLGSDEYSGYFSDPDSNRISINAPGTGNLPVLTVTLDTNESPVFLRGDIGVDFTGTQWTTFSAEQYVKNAETADMLANYYPETDFQVFRQKLMFQGYNPDDFIGFQKIKIEYLRSTRVALVPVAPYELNYKTGDILESTGDFVLRLKKQSGTLKTYESLTLYPIMNNMDFGTALANTSDYDYSAMEWTLPNGISMETYNSYKSVYDRFVTETYLGVPEAEKDNIVYLLGEIKKYGYDVYGIDKNSTKDRYNTAEAICSFFHSNYTYSLTADNTDKTYGTTIGSFLQKTKSGHCALYATSMVLAMRSLGIPARYVTGYVVQGNGTPVNGGYEYTLRDRNLHAWVEVYFPEIGWLPFDPTSSNTSYSTVATTTPSSSETNTTTPSTTRPSEESTSASHATTTSKPENSISGSGTELSLTPAEQASISREAIFAIVIIAASVLAVVLLVLWLVSLKKAEQKFFAKMRKVPEKYMSELFTFTLRLLSAFGIEQKKGELPVAFAIRTDKKFPLENGSMCDVMSIFEKAEFSGGELSHEECALAAEYVYALYSATVLKANPLKKIICRAALF
ncbi:MAG: transglutaminase family protein [Ruminiclostridium sp.]